LSEIITSKSNTGAKRLKHLGESSSFRREAGEFLCEGENLLREALYERAEITCLFYTDTAPRELLREARDRAVPCYGATDAVIRHCSTVITPQSVLFSARSPEFSPPPPGGKYLVLDAVRDPGNVGTILRSADAFAIDAVIMTDDCADPLSPKTVRSTMGAVFRQRISVIRRENAGEFLSLLGVPVYGASADEGARDIRKADLSRCAVIIGNESNGLSREMRSLCTGILKIPMKGRAESLNASVAAGIAAFFMSSFLN